MICEEENGQGISIKICVVTSLFRLILLLHGLTIDTKSLNYSLIEKKAGISCHILLIFAGGFREV